MAQFDLSQYETVDSRIHKFWEKYPNGRILTDVFHLTETGGIFKASIYTDRDDERPAAVDFAEEVKGSSPVNKTSWVENGLTSAIGRALADLGFSPKPVAGAKSARPSREEMEKVQRGAIPAAKFDRGVMVKAIASATTKDALRELYKSAGDQLDVEFLDGENTVTLKSLILARQAELPEVK
jgi:hypothetical protein